MDRFLSEAERLIGAVADAARRDLLVMFLEHAPTLEIARRWFLDVLTDG